MNSHSAFFDGIALTDAGLETVLIFDYGLDLPAFAAFPLLDSDVGRAHLQRYYRDFLDLAALHSTSLILETPTWRANPDWAAQLGYDASALSRIQHDSVAFVRGVAAESPNPVVVSGSVGPRGDGYVPGDTMSAQEAAAYHRVQIADFAAAGADLVTSFTFPYADEGVGFALAAADVGIPAVVGFTVETDGRLPSGESLAEAVQRVDEATDGSVAWFMVNCAHPEHVLPGVSGNDEWLARIGAVRANASRMSHAELDEAESLDAGDPADLASNYLVLREQLINLRVLGGCCGTDVSHVSAIADAWLASGGYQPA